MARASREVWAKRVERWKDSGLTAKEYAAEVGCNPRTLTFWKYELGRSQDGSSRKRTVEPPKFVEVESQQDVGRPFDPIELVVGDVVLRVPAAFDQKHLSNVLSAVKAAC